MFEPVSTVASLVWLGHAALYPYAQQGSAFSPEAQTIRQAAASLVQSVERSQALFGAKQRLIAELRAVAADCGEADWDNMGALPIDPLALHNAEKLTRFLPDRFPLPEVAPEPDGSLSLDWIRSPHRLFSLSVGASNRLAFAWLDGSDKGHGVVGFDGVSIPDRLLDDIRRIVGVGNATVGVA